jgi:precorrin-2 methylase
MARLILHFEGRSSSHLEAAFKASSPNQGLITNNLPLINHAVRSGGATSVIGDPTTYRNENHVRNEMEAEKTITCKLKNVNGVNHVFWEERQYMAWATGSFSALIRPEDR